MPLTNNSTTKPQEIAAIDLGSNSFHMVIARVVNGALQVLGRLKQRVHLADGLDSNNMLSEEAIERGLACLALFAERLQGSPQITCVSSGLTPCGKPPMQRHSSNVPPRLSLIPLKLSRPEEARLILWALSTPNQRRAASW